MVGDVRETGSLGMKLKLLERLRRSRDKHKLEYLEPVSYTHLTLPTILRV